MRIGFITRFLKLESTSGIILFVTALAALILCNSPLGALYQKFWETHLIIRINRFQLDEPHLFWVNEGLMTLFFLMVGLELKREVLEGQLSTLSQVFLPGVGAAGGMILPALFYFFINIFHPELLRGWAIPVATDIAFALGVLSLFGKRIPAGLKIFLMALAIFDDIGAIVIIAVFYNHALSFLFLALALVLTWLIYLFNKAGFIKLWIYLLGGALLWVLVLKSGIHPTIAGVLLAFLVPSQNNFGTNPSLKLQNFLHPWVAFFVMPLFAFANAGLSLSEVSAQTLTHTLTHTLTLGIVAGLFLGKQAGVFGSIWLAVRFHWAKLPVRCTLGQMYAMAILCGIGFTMSLFLGNLAFQGNPVYLNEVRLGVLVGSSLSGVIGALVLYVFLKRAARC